MEVKRIIVSFGGKVPTVQYGNTDIMVTHEIELAPGEDAAEATRQALITVKAAAVEEVKLLPAYGARSWLNATQAAPEKPVVVQSVSAPAEPVEDDEPEDDDDFEDDDFEDDDDGDSDEDEDNDYS